MTNADISHMVKQTRLLAIHQCHSVFQ